ncbi:MAG: NUDIX hydrolase [Chloroflexota bacterium]
MRVDRARTHMGLEVEYAYLEVPAAAMVVPLTRDGRIVLIQQYRHPIRGWAWEIPAGAVGEEEPIEAARRELGEEVGGTCGELRSLGGYYSSSGGQNLYCHAFLGLDVELGETRHEDTELIRVRALPAEDAFNWARDGRLNECTSALAVLMAEPHVRALRSRH